MANLVFNHNLLVAKSIQLDLIGSVVRGPVTDSGQQQLVMATGGGLWSLRMTFARLHRADQIRTWRALQYGSDGGVVAINVPICDLRQSPARSYIGAGVPHSDGSPFSDGSLYTSSSITAVLALDADLRATTVRMTFANGERPLGGEFFSLQAGDDHELHVTLKAVHVSGDTYDVTVRPPLRRDHLAGALVDFNRPRCTMQLATPDSMSMAVEMGRLGSPTAAFLEKVP